MAVGQYLDFSAKGNRVLNIINILLCFRITVCQVVLFPHIAHKPLEVEEAIWGFKAACNS